MTTASSMPHVDRDTGATQPIDEHGAEGGCWCQHTSALAATRQRVCLQRERERGLAQKRDGGTITRVTLIRDDTPHLLAAFADAEQLAGKPALVHRLG